MEEDSKSYPVGTVFWNGNYTLEYSDGVKEEKKGKVELFPSGEIKMFNGEGKEFLPRKGKKFSIFTNGGKKPFYVCSLPVISQPPKKKAKK